MLFVRSSVVCAKEDEVAISDSEFPEGEHRLDEGVFTLSESSSCDPGAGTGVFQTDIL